MIQRRHQVERKTGSECSWNTSSVTRVFQPHRTTAIKVNNWILPMPLPTLVVRGILAMAWVLSLCPHSFSADRAQATAVKQASPAAEVSADAASDAFSQLEQQDRTGNAAEQDREAGRTGPKELSVEPGSDPLLPPDRPQWVASPPDLTSSVHRIFVGSELVPRREEADAALDDPMVRALKEYFGRHVLQQPGEADKLDVSAAFIRKNLLNRNVSYMAKLTTSGGPLFQKWVVLEVTPEQREYLRGKYVEALQRERVAPLGVGVAGILIGVFLLNFVARLRVRRYSMSKTGVVNAGSRAARPDPTVTKV